METKTHQADDGARDAFLAKAPGHRVRAGAGEAQAAKGRETRSALMSLLHTLDACRTDPAARLAQALDKHAQDPRTDMFAALFGGLPLYIPTQ